MYLVTEVSASDTKHIIIFTHMLKMMDLDLLRVASFIFACLVRGPHTTPRTAQTKARLPDPGVTCGVWWRGQFKTSFS